MATKLKSKSKAKTLKRKLGPHSERIAWVLVALLNNQVIAKAKTGF